MAKKKRSINPAQRRARRQARVARRTENDSVSDTRSLSAHLAGIVDTGEYVDDQAHAALTARGWVPMGGEERGAFGGDTWEWPPSHVETTEEPWFHPTSITPGAAELIVETVAPHLAHAHGDIRYDTLDELLADIAIIESYRHGDPFPSFPHARASRAPSPTD